MHEETIWIVLLVLHMSAHWTIVSTYGAGDTWAGCSSKVCGWPRQPVTCKDSVILIENATSARDATFDEHAFLNIRRMCMGKPECDLQKFCHNQHPGRSLKVTYVCVEDQNILKQCNSSPQQRHRGFILSPDYPAGSTYKKCNWRILVPDNYYVVMRMHELELQSFRRNARCEGGLKFKTERTCDGRPFPDYVVCGVPVDDNIDQNFVACGNVDIEFSNSEGGEYIRFWLSYQVKPMSSSEDSAPMAGMVRPCPALSTRETLETVMRDAPIPENLPVFTVTEVTPSIKINKSVVIVQDEKALSPVDTTERTVLYVAVAVAAASLMALVIIVIVCLRRQTTNKHVQTTNQNGIHEPHNSQQQRPLPEINKTSNATISGDPPVLQDGYSRVADEIPASDVTPTSPAYAEVEENSEAPKSRIVFKFNPGPQVPKPKPKPLVARRRPPEHLYSEPNEILPQKPYTKVTVTPESSPSLGYNDQAQLLKDKVLSKNSSVGEDQKSELGNGVEGPYASCDIINQYIISDSQSNLLSRCESDDSLVLTENEIYEPFESAHV